MIAAARELLPSEETVRLAYDSDGEVDGVVNQGAAEAVLLTRGSEGALAVTRAGAYGARVAIEGVRNTVGCGDAFLAGYLAGLWREESAIESLKLAVACGAAAALSDAAGEIDPDTVARLRAAAEAWGV